MTKMICRESRRSVLTDCGRMARAITLLAIMASYHPSRVAAADEPGFVVTVTRPIQRARCEAVVRGRLEPAGVIEVRAQADGEVATVHVEVGDKVSAGAELVSLDRGPLAAELSIQADAVEDSHRDLQSRLDDVAAAEQAQAGPFDIDVARARAEVAAAELAAQEIRLAELREALDGSVLRAPVAGIIRERQVQPGDKVAGGSRPTLVAKLETVSSGRATFALPVSLRDELLLRSREPPNAAGRVNVRMRLAGEDGWPRAGTVLGPLPTVDPRTRLATMTAVFEFADQPLEEIFNDQASLSVSIQVSATADDAVLLVPACAVQRDSAGRPYVAVVDSHEQIVHRHVAVAPAGVSWWTVEAGLDPDDRIVLGCDQSTPPGQTSPDEEFSPDALAANARLRGLTPGTPVVAVEVALTPPSADVIVPLNAGEQDANVDQ